MPQTSRLARLWICMLVATATAPLVVVAPEASRAAEADVGDESDVGDVGEATPSAAVQPGAAVEPGGAAAARRSGVRRGSLADRRARWPTWAQWRRVLLLEDYNTRVVVTGTSLLGLAAGMVGSFTLLRKRALTGDALSHATLPGIGLAFIAATMWGTAGKTLPVLLAGAALSGLFGMWVILLIRNTTRLKEDAALGIVLSVFFGGGIAILGVVQQMKTGHAAGLEAFIYGKTASMVVDDAWLIGVSGLFCAAVSVLLFKELKLLCFDESFAGSRGFPVMLLDMILMGLVVIVTIIGLQAVGLILMIALLVIPAAAARFWTEHMRPMAVVAALLGGVSSLVGSAMSALFPRLPSGAMIVLVSTAFFLASLICGPHRGVISRAVRRWRLHRKIDREHLLRGLYEQCEIQAGGGLPDYSTAQAVAFDRLLALRSWPAWRLRRVLRRATRQGLVESSRESQIALSNAGFREAARLVRDHRLWELYLITYADVAPGNVDRDADRIEHVLEPDLVARLEKLLEEREAAGGVPRSPHPIGAAADETGPA